MHKKSGSLDFLKLLWSIILVVNFEEHALKKRRSFYGSTPSQQNAVFGNVKVYLSKANQL